MVDFMRKTVPKALKDQLWDQIYGKNVGCVRCPICNIHEIRQSDFEAGHIVARAKGGDTTLENLRPICKACNRSMGTQHMDEYKNKYYPTERKTSVVEPSLEEKRFRELQVARYKELQEEAQKIMMKKTSENNMSQCYLCSLATGEKDLNFICCDVYIHPVCLTRFYEKAKATQSMIKVMLWQTSCPECFKKS